MNISGKDLSKSLKEELKVRVEALGQQYGRTPNLVVVLVGEDPGSVSYVTGKAKAATEVGLFGAHIHLFTDLVGSCLTSKLLEHLTGVS